MKRPTAGGGQAMPSAAGWFNRPAACDSALKQRIGRKTGQGDVDQYTRAGSAVIA